MMYPPLGDIASARRAARAKGNKSRFVQLKRNYDATFGKVPRPGSLQYRQRFLNRYKASRAQQEIGEPVGSGGAKRSIQLHDVTSFPTKSLYSHEVTEIGKSSINSINQRQRDIINLVGIKYLLEVRNGSSDSRPVIVNYALISPKGGADVRDPVTPTSVTTVDFFRGYQTTRSQNFAATFSSVYLNNGTINSDKYNILMHKKMTLGGSNNNSPRARHVTGYVPINRQIRYDDAAINSCNSPIFFVAWQSYMVDTAAATSFAAGEITFERICYFREPVN